MLDLGVEALGLHFTAPFIDPVTHPAKAARGRERAAQLGLPLREIDVWPDYLALLRDPRYGHGAHLNPCVDCKIFFLRRAKQIMEEEGWDFVFTGEVLGQRPMSQHRGALDLIQRQSGLAGRLLRPLCAQHLAPTIPETEGLVDRARLLALQGRSRKPQMALAAQMGIADPPGSAGGCLLTDGPYTVRLRHLLSLKERPEHGDLHLLVVGRHVTLPGGGKAIVSRNENENRLLRQSQAVGDVLLSPVDWAGPDALLVGARGEAVEALTASLIRRWGKPQGQGLVAAFDLQSGQTWTFAAPPAPPEEVIQAMLLH
jgi:hypothetical protein